MSDSETKIDFFQLPLPAYLKLFGSRQNPIMNDIIQHGINPNDKTWITRFDLTKVELGRINQSRWFIFPDSSGGLEPFPISCNSRIVIADNSGNSLGQILALYIRSGYDSREYASCANCSHKCNNSGLNSSNLVCGADCTCSSVSDYLKQTLISLNIRSNRPQNLCLSCEKYQPK